jgi:ketosteroid isomerase-like protein
MWFAMTTMTREQMDEIVNQHFRFEAEDDIEGVVNSLTEDADHEIIPSPMGPVKGREQARAYYEMLFPCLEDGAVTPVRRLYGEDFIVDETIWHGQLLDGHPFLLDGKSGEIEFRLLHIFNLRDGKISGEQAWCDLALMQQNLGCTIS